MIFEQILAALRVGKKDLTASFCDALTTPLPVVIEQLNSLSLFGSMPTIIFDGLDQLKKSGWDPLFTYVEKPSRFAHLLLGSSQARNTAELYKKGKKELIVLDLSEEKAWDRKTRFQRYLVDQGLRAGKKLSLEAALHLIEQVGLDLPRLEQELIKLLCFVGDRNVIELKDIQDICTVEKHLSTWQLSEMIVWEKNQVSSPPAIDLAWLFPFLGQLRYQLQIGLQLAVMLDAHTLPGIMAKQLPQLRGPLLEKRMAVAKQWGQRYFRSGLLHLFEIELLAKNSGGTASLLFDLLTAKLAGNHP